MDKRLDLRCRKERHVDGPEAPRRRQGRQKGECRLGFGGRSSTPSAGSQADIAASFARAKAAAKQRDEAAKRDVASPPRSRSPSNARSEGATFRPRRFRRKGRKLAADDSVPPFTGGCWALIPAPVFDPEESKESYMQHLYNWEAMARSWCRHGIFIELCTPCSGYVPPPSDSEEY